MTRRDLFLFNRLLLLLAASASMFVLSGCGNKGPLVMPDKPVAEQSATEATTPVDPAAPVAPTTEQPPEQTSGEDDPGERG